MSQNCPICGIQSTGYSQETEVLEVYVDGLGKPSDGSRIPAGPIRRMVPGPTVTTMSPCGHEVLAP